MDLVVNQVIEALDENFILKQSFLLLFIEQFIELDLHLTIHNILLISK